MLSNGCCPLSISHHLLESTHAAWRWSSAVRSLSHVVTIISFVAQKPFGHHPLHLVASLDCPECIILTVPDAVDCVYTVQNLGIKLFGTDISTGSYLLVLTLV